MSDFAIEKGVPLPPLKTGLTDTLRRMEVGDSFAFGPGRRDTVRAMMHRVAGEMGVSFTMRFSENEWRVWRVK